MENTHEAIIPKEMYDKVQMLKGNRKKKIIKYIYTC